MNKDTASRQGPTAEQLPRGSGGEAGVPGEGANLHLHWAAQMIINCFFKEAAVLSICQSMLGHSLSQGCTQHFWCPWF